MELWKDAKVCECMNPREKLLFVYLLTNPYTTQIGIYKITIKQIAFDLGLTKPYIKGAIEKFEKEYNLIRYNNETNELAIRNWGKFNLVRLGKPIEMCIEKELKGVRDVSLVEYVLGGIESSRAREIYGRFLEDRNLGNTEKYDYVTYGSQGEKENKKQKQNNKENKDINKNQLSRDNVISFGGRDNGKFSKEIRVKGSEDDERPSEDMLNYAREL